MERTRNTLLAEGTDFRESVKIMELVMDGELQAKKKMFEHKFLSSPDDADLWRAVLEHLLKVYVPTPTSHAPARTHDTDTHTRTTSCATSYIY